ncbi:MAG: biotin attachment protein [Flavobacteriaceae bacterium]|nr:MAG: biotin attachment protein [Flavobacteriaceae bacterium]
MKNTLKHIALSLTITSVLVSCTPEEITALRGKVKYETLSVTTKISGRIAQLFVIEGQQVQQGDTLAIIDVPEVDAKLAQVAGAIEAAKAQLLMAHNGATNEQITQIEGKLDAAKAQLNYAKESFSRVQNMFQDSLVSSQKMDEVRMKLQMATAQVKAIKAKKQDVLNGTRTEIIAQANGMLARAKGVEQEVLVATGEQYIIAPADMSIETITLRKGELATPGYTLFNGYELSSVYFRFTVNEAKVYNYKVGQELTIENPYTKKKFKCKIIAIKQLARYADITSTSPLYKLSEAVYELKIIPLEKVSTGDFYLNATALIQ